MTAPPTPACSAVTLRTPGPGRDTRRTDPYPAAAGGPDDPETTTAMSDDDPDRTRLGSHQRGRARQWRLSG
jgi:hypothetical protein